MCVTEVVSKNAYLYTNVNGIQVCIGAPQKMLVSKSSGLANFCHAFAIALHEYWSDHHHQYASMYDKVTALLGVKGNIKYLSLALRYTAVR